MTDHPVDLNHLKSSPNEKVEVATEEWEAGLEQLLERNTELTTQLAKARQTIAKLKKQRSNLLDEIVRAGSEDEADLDDDDSQWSEGDIDSDMESSDDFEVTKKEDVVELDTHIEPPVKRRRLAQPRRQRQMKPVDVPKDDNGNYILPVDLGRTKLLSLGEIIPEEGFFNQNYIFPVGYSIQRTYKSMVREEDFTVYTCSIDKDETNKPLFCIEAEDAPEIVIRKPTPTAAWSEVLRRSNILRKKEFKNTVSGPEYYGLSLPTVKKMIQELPRAAECAGYQMVDF